MRTLLREVKNVREELKDLKAKIKALDEVLYAPSRCVLDDMPKAHSGAKNGILEGLIEREELEEEYDEKLLWYLTQKAGFEALFREKLTVSEARVLENYYFGGMTWDKVAETLDISPSWAFKLHRRAMKKIH